MVVQDARDELVATAGGADQEARADPSRDLVGITVGAQPHDLVFPVQHPEPEVTRDRRVEVSERIRQVVLLEDVDPRPAPKAPARASRLASPVHDQDRGLLERGRVEAARHVAGVVVVVHDRRHAPVALLEPSPELEHADPARVRPLLRSPKDSQRAPEPLREEGRALERGLGHEARPKRQVVGVPVERDLVQVAEREPPRLQGPLQSPVGDPALVLDPREALLLRCRRHDAILEEDRRGLSHRR